eukprot:TRINITY_DN4716_c0_g1_i1.p1 TRINITY_DN4716_c0_g1~~TRINITY_DN4716_c0_g1_i1.p1  ORF type:complete len:73 (+),score=2.11 TRINITY_DN4716_c0_g1_i1:215-433(+)
MSDLAMFDQLLDTATERRYKIAVIDPPVSSFVSLWTFCLTAVIFVSLSGGTKVLNDLNDTKVWMRRGSFVTN